MYYVYQYSDPINYIPFYIGKGKNGSNRHLNHLKEASGEWNVDYKNKPKKGKIKKY